MSTVEDATQATRPLNVDKETDPTTTSQGKAPDAEYLSTLSEDSKLEKGPEDPSRDDSSPSLPPPPTPPNFIPRGKPSKPVQGPGVRGVRGKPS